MIPLIIIAIHFNFYFSLTKEFHASESVNPKATAYFIHASAITVSWINILHSSFGVSYDNPIMKPIASIRDYYFNLGEKYVNKDNAENVIWWSYNYARMYGFATGDKNNAYVIYKLDVQTQRVVREKMYHHIVKLGTYGVKGIYAGIHTDPLKDMTDLVSGYIMWISKMYDGETDYKKTQKFYLDIEQHKRLMIIYQYYYKASKKSPLSFNKKHYHHYFRFRLLESVIYGSIYRSGSFLELLCNSQWIDDYMNLFAELAQWSSDNVQKTQGEVRLSKLFKKIALSNSPNQISTYILKEIDNRCINYPQASKFLKLKITPQR